MAEGRADALYVFHARARASRELSRPVWVSVWAIQVTHCPGGPTTAGAEPDASDVRRACTTQPGPGAAGLGTSGEAGPGTDVKPAHAASAGGPCREPPILGEIGALTRGLRCTARRRSHEPTAVRQH